MLATVPVMVFLNFCLNFPWLSAGEKNLIAFKRAYIFTSVYAHSAHMICVFKPIPSSDIVSVLLFSNKDFPHLLLL